MTKERLLEGETAEISRLSLDDCERLTDAEVEERVRHKEPSSPSEIKFSLSGAVFTGYPPETIIRVAANLGFNGLEPLLTSQFLKRNPDDLKRLADRYELEMLSFHAPYFTHHTKLGTFSLPKDKRLIPKRDIRIGLGLLFLMPNLLQSREQITKMVGAFKAPLVVHTEQVYLADRILNNKDGIFDWMKELNKDGLLLVEDAELSFVAEPYAQELRPQNFAKAYPEFFRRALDTGYLASYFGDNLFRWIERMDLKTVNIHLSDALVSEFKVHLPLGEGELPLRQLLYGLHQIGYQGTLTLETVSRKAAYLGAPQFPLTQKIAERMLRPILKESLAFARKYTCS